MRFQLKALQLILLNHLAMDLPDRMLPLAQFIMDMRFMVAFINPYERDKAMGVSK